MIWFKFIISVLSGYQIFKGRFDNPYLWKFQDDLLGFAAASAMLPYPVH